MKLSVALCTYNGERFLKEQLDSILNQTVSVHEIVVCDDCSTDKTKALLENYKLNYPSIFQLHFNKTNLRSNKNFEQAISLCTGDFIFLSDQDDIWRSDKVEKIMQTFNENPTAKGVFTNANFIGENGESIHNSISLWESVSFFEEHIKNASDLKKSLIYIANFLTGATLCIKKEVLEYCIPFQTISNFIHDEWLAFALCNKNSLVFNSEKLISYRLHSSQQLGVSKIKNPEKKKKENIKFNELMLEIRPPKSFHDYKAKSRAHFYQYEKYLNLYKSYKTPIYKEVSDDLKEKYIETDLLMQKKNFVLHFIRKMQDKKKGRRQL